MSGIWLKRIELIGTTGELVGRKSGLALTREELAEKLGDLHEDVWSGGSDDDEIRIRPEEFEEIVAEVLYRVGNIRSPSIAPPGISSFHKYKGDKVLFPIFEAIHSRLAPFLEKAVEGAVTSVNKTIDPSPFVREACDSYGEAGALIAIEMIEDLAEWQHRNPWTDYRRVEWSDTAELQDLFKGESLETQYGRFLDQRFVDYLYRNFGDIDRINWRKFEGSTAEFFDRLGCDVRIGKGRNDGGVDVRVWQVGSSNDDAPTILVQCKRENRQIGKVIVKALWADVVAWELPCRVARAAAPNRPDHRLRRELFFAIRGRRFKVALIWRKEPNPASS